MSGMTNWRTDLRDADRALLSGVQPADVQRVRQAVLAAARQSQSAARARWRRPAMLVAAMSIMVGAWVTMAWQIGAQKMAVRYADERQDGAGNRVDPADGDVTPYREVERQQLQFATPGGTRIIWVFDSTFDLEGTLP